jgi:DNA-binding transcriptional ArsR family regulator
MAWRRIVYFPISEYDWAMARAATTSDVFNAIAEPQRREILNLLKHSELSVGGVADSLGLKQPATSKHLRVLREVGLVHVRRFGKQRVYGLDARGLSKIHEWTGGFEEFWIQSFDRLNEYVKTLEEGTKDHG